MRADRIFAGHVGPHPYVLVRQERPLPDKADSFCHPNAHTLLIPENANQGHLNDLGRLIALTYPATGFKDVVPDEHD